MRYEYKVVPAPARGEKAKGVKAPEGRFAYALEHLLNDMGAEGWEFQRAETLPSEERQGLTGSITVWRNVLVFRRGVAAQEAVALLEGPARREAAEVGAPGLGAAGAAATGLGTAGLGEWQKRSAYFRRVIDEFDAIERGDPAYFSMQFLKSQKTDRVAARLLLDTMADLGRADLARITCPTLVVCGDEDRDNGSAEALADLLPDATFVEVPGTHMGSVTKPDLGQAMAEWLGPAKG